MRKSLKMRSGAFGALLVFAGLAAGATITVGPGASYDFADIQPAMDAASESDEIVVAIGRYYENIDFGGKDILLRSTEPNNPAVVGETIIDGLFGYSVVTFVGTESAACILSGFTLTNGYGYGTWHLRGGGIYGNGALATIQHNIISENRATLFMFPSSGSGGGLYDCDGTIQYNIISRNEVACSEGHADGGGLFGCDGTIENNIISYNSASGFGPTSGGGLASCNGTIRNNTIFGNSAKDYAGGGGGGLADCSGTITNCIVWGNNTGETGGQLYNCATPSYCCIEGWTGEGAGNITYDPCFVDAPGGDYHLFVDSPCIDAGDPCYSPAPGETDIDGEPRVMNGHVDIGTDEVNNEEPLIGVSPGEVAFLLHEGGADPEPQILSIWNAGADVINWEIIEDCGWLEARPTNGASSGQVNEVTLIANASGLGVGLYICNLEVHDETATNSPQTVSIALHVFSEVVHVPSEVPTIQGAINLTLDGGTVIVADGTYTGPGNRDMDFGGRAITVTSENGPDNCIIDCNGTEADPHRGFYFHNGEDANSVVNGLTIINGYALSYYERGGGGAICCEHSSPLIANCVITQNFASSRGGGVACWKDSHATIANCTLTHNAARYGGGMYTKDNNARITGCVFTSNSAEGPVSPTPRPSGGGMRISGGSGRPVLTRCTFSANSAGDRGGAIWNTNTRFTLTNCILWGNLPHEIYGGVTASYCDIQGGWPGGSNIDADPCFADANNGDFHLKSEAGRWDSAGGSWVQDDVTSPCIDRGDPNSDWAGELWPHGKRINMGAYGGTAEASMSQSSEGNAADCNYDDAVNGTDLEMIAERWLDQGVLLVEDVNRDGVISFPDFALLAQSWLWEQ